ncbi:MAG: PAS domain-containing sensor histidine kinase [Actinobacteria bacterium]|nr:PAS domain-containing sensor histidine kinase [Actinomycetota bacterium]
MIDSTDPSPERPPRQLEPEPEDPAELHRQLDEALDALAEAEERYRRLMEDVPVGLYRTTPDGRILEVNPTLLRIMGYERAEDLYARRAEDQYLDPEERRRWREEMERDGVVIDFEARLRRRDGTIRWVLDSARAVKDRNGRTLYYQGSMRDVTERKLAEQELERGVHLLRRAAEERRMLLARLVRAQEEERRRIAVDIHDDSVQTITALGYRLYSLRRFTGPEGEEALQELEEEVGRAVERLRTLMFELRPPALDQQGLAAAIRAFLSEGNIPGGIEHRLVDGIVTEPPAEIRATLYRIVQEAVTNVRKHAGASRVEVALEERDAGIVVRVTDDGGGFDPRELWGEAPGRPGHLGLTAMRERAEVVGGRLSVETVRGRGTTVEAWVPVTEAEPAEPTPR